MTSMPTLKDFIVEAMWSIHGAVDELQRRAAQDTPKIEQGSDVIWNHRPAFAPEVRVEGSPASGLFYTAKGQIVTVVQFDVAVVATGEFGGKLGAGILVAGVGLGGKAEGKVSAQDSSRIQFNIPVMFPNPDNYVWEEQQKKKVAANVEPKKVASRPPTPSDGP